jgi:DNA ligase-1
MNAPRKFPTLYATAATGKSKVWNIETRWLDAKKGHALIHTEHGYEGGKMTVAQTEVTAGKNIGRSNETTPIQQANMEAESKWKKKQDQGYAEAGATAPAAKEEVLLPMLAVDYNKRGKSVVFPCFVQAKLDGVRCTYQGGKLYSRNSKAFPHLDHI